MNNFKKLMPNHIQTIAYPNSFDFLRFYAAFSVLIVHSTVNFNISFFISGDECQKWFSDGVPLFFILSGFLVYNSYEKCIVNNKSILQFFRNRLLRIAPAIFFYTIIVTILLFALGVFNTNNFSFTWLISNLFLIPIYHPEELRGFGTGVLNGSLWTIPVELSFYFSVPILYYIENKYGIKKMIIILIGLTFLGKGLYVGLLDSVYKDNLLVSLFGVTFIPNFVHFTFGIVMLKYWASIKYCYNNRLFVVCLVIYAFLIFVKKENLILINMISAVPLSYIAIWLGFKLPSIFYKLTNRIGDLSYGIYIWHMPVINMIIYLGINKYFHNGTLLVFLVFSITCIIAKVSWNFVEKPSIKLKKYSMINKDQLQ